MKEARCPILLKLCCVVCVAMCRCLYDWINWINHQAEAIMGVEISRGKNMKYNFIPIHIRNKTAIKIANNVRIAYKCHN
jgi:hypothetical protein